MDQFDTPNFCMALHTDADMQASAASKQVYICLWNHTKNGYFKLDSFSTPNSLFCQKNPWIYRIYYSTPILFRHIVSLSWPIKISLCTHAFALWTVKREPCFFFCLFFVMKIIQSIVFWSDKDLFDRLIITFLHSSK